MLMAKTTNQGKNNHKCAKSARRHRAVDHGRYHNAALACHRHPTPVRSAGYTVAMCQSFAADNHPRWQPDDGEMHEYSAAIAAIHWQIPGSAKNHAKD